MTECNSYYILSQTSNPTYGSHIDLLITSLLPHPIIFPSNPTYGSHRDLSPMSLLPHPIIFPSNPTYGSHSDLYLSLTSLPNGSFLPIRLMGATVTYTYHSLLYPIIFPSNPTYGSRSDLSPMSLLPHPIIFPSNPTYGSHTVTYESLHFYLTHIALFFQS